MNPVLSSEPFRLSQTFPLTDKLLSGALSNPQRPSLPFFPVTNLNTAMHQPPKSAQYKGISSPHLSPSYRNSMPNVSLSSPSLVSYAREHCISCAYSFYTCPFHTATGPHTLSSQFQQPFDDPHVSMASRSPFDADSPTSTSSSSSLTPLSHPCDTDHTASGAYQKDDGGVVDFELDLDIDMDMDMDIDDMDEASLLSSADFLQRPVDAGTNSFSRHGLSKPNPQHSSEANEYTLSREDREYLRSNPNLFDMLNLDWWGDYEGETTTSQEQPPQDSVTRLETPSGTHIPGSAIPMPIPMPFIPTLSPTTTVASQPRPHVSPLSPMYSVPESLLHTRISRPIRIPLHHPQPVRIIPPIPLTDLTDEARSTVIGI